MKRLTLRIKLIAAFSVLTVILVIMGVLNFRGLKSVISIMNDITHEQLPAIESLLIIHQAMTQIESGENQLLCTSLDNNKLDEIYKSFDEAFKVAESEWKAYENLASSGIEKELKNKFEPAYENWKKDHTQYLKLSEEYEKNKKDTIYMEMVNIATRTSGTNYDLSASILRELIEYNKKESKANTILSDQIAASAINMIIIIILLGIAISLVVGVTVVRSVMKQLGGDPSIVVEAANRIADSDLTFEFHIMHNDRSSALYAMSRMTDELSLTIANIIDASENLAQAVEEISAGNMNLSQRTTEQASSLEEIASTIEETTATVQQNSENTNNANKLCGETVAIALDVKGKSDESITLAESGGKVIVDAVSSIEEVNKSSKKINDIVGVINEISFQTNLLALNAAVEAARAGDQGRGFAVVAGEVRNLAQRAGTSSKEISKMISESIDAIQTGTTQVYQSGDALKEIILSSQETGNAIGSVVSSINTLKNVLAEILAASEEQRRGMEQISIAIQQLDTMTQDNSALVEETASAGEEMASQAQELAAMVANFKIKESAGSTSDNRAKQPARQDKGGDYGYSKKSPVKQSSFTGSSRIKPGTGKKDDGNCDEKCVDEKMNKDGYNKF